MNLRFDNKYIVSLVKGDLSPTNEQIHQMVFDAIDYIGGIELFIKEGDRVLIKPNAGSETNWENCTVTNPHVVEAIANICKDAGAGEVIIGEAAQIGTNTEKVFIMNGYPEISKRTGSRLIDLNKDEIVNVKIDGRILKNVRSFKTVFDCDSIINVPVIKTHVLAGITLGLKNLKGLIPVEEKRRFHMVGLDGAIADLQLAIQPKLTLVDGIRALGGLGAPVHLGEVVELGLIIAGFNPVAVDAVTCRVVGFDPSDIKHLVYAEEHGIGSLDPENIEIRGDSIEKVRFCLEKPSYEFKELSEYENIRVVQKGACSSCIGSIFTALKLCYDMGELQRLSNISCFIGPQASPQGKSDDNIIIGKCLWKFRESGNYVPGCPPLVMQIRDELREMIGSPRISGSKKKFLEATNYEE